MNFFSDPVMTYLSAWETTWDVSRWFFLNRENRPKRSYSCFLYCSSGRRIIRKMTSDRTTAPASRKRAPM